jgi:Tfp pilus assembly protein PilO
MDAIAKTFRYLDEAEVAAQNAQKKPGKPGAKK